MEKKIKIEELSISDLIKYETGAEILCKFYENVVKNYDGSVIDNVEEYKKYTKFNTIYLNIIKELENRLSLLENGKKD